MKLTTLSAAGLVKVLVLLAGAGHAAQEAIPWQVKDADVRIPVTVSIDDTLKRMPPDVYLADLNPTGTKGLAFDRKTKSAVMHDLGTPEQRESIIGLSGLDPTEFIPLACDLRGRQVGCRILRAHPGEPMTILFDSSSGEKHYMVYLVPRLTQPLRLDWTPKAGVILECRYPDRYDPAISTLEGLRKLWDGAGFIAGKETVTRYLTGGSAGHDADARRHPATVIAHAFPPFRIPPPVDEMRNFSDASRLRRSSLALARYTGFFHIPETREYEFKFNAGPAGYMLMDDQVISEWRVEDKPQTDQWRKACLLYTSPSPRDRQKSRMPSSA